MMADWWAQNTQLVVVTEKQKKVPRFVDQRYIDVVYKQEDIATTGQEPWKYLELVYLRCTLLVKKNNIKLK